LSFGKSNIEMNYISTIEQQAYIETSGKIVLNACPGSGKTSTIAHKLIRVAKDWGTIYGNSGGIACLSFTNVAKNEIAEKFRETSDFPLSYPHTISTIDSFVNMYITLPFIHKLLGGDKRFRIVDDVSYIDRLFRNNWQYIKAYKNLIYRFEPSKIDFDINGSIVWDGHDKSGDADFVKYGKAIKGGQYKALLLKTSDSAFLALQILRKFPRISKYLVARFPYLIIDEAQDTSEIQHAILDELIKGGLQHLDLVGDPYQCLYQWRNASPELFLNKFDDKENWNGMRLTENRRSTQRIVNVFSPLRRNDEQPITSPNNTETDLFLHILKYPIGSPGSIIPIYEKLCLDHSFVDNRVLVRGNTLRNSLLGKHASFEPWSHDLPYKLIEAKIHLESNETKEAIRKVKRLFIGLMNPDLDYQALKEKEDEAQSNHALHAQLFNLVRTIPSFDLPIKQWTSETENYLKNALALIDCPKFGIRTRSSKSFDIKNLNNPVSQYFKKATTESNLPITTIHQVKGMTFDSVLLILSENNAGQNISLDYFIKPENMPTEKQRLIYVGISRPRKLLCLGVPITYTDNELKTKFGENIVILQSND